MTPVFVDTGYLIAIGYIPDQHHSAAVRRWKPFLRNPPQLVTTGLVLSGVVAFFNSRGRHAKAVDVARRLMDSPGVRLVHVDQELFEAGLDSLERRPDKRFSLADRVSLVLMNKLGIQQAPAFDSHFDQAGFARLPQ